MKTSLSCPVISIYEKSHNENKLIKTCLEEVTYSLGISNKSYYEDEDFLPRTNLFAIAFSIMNPSDVGNILVQTLSLKDGDVFVYNVLYSLLKLNPEQAKYVIISKSELSSILG